MYLVKTQTSILIQRYFYNLPLEFFSVVAKIEQDLTLGCYIIGLKLERGFMSALTKAIYCLHKVYGVCKVSAGPGLSMARNVDCGHI